MPKAISMDVHGYRVTFTDRGETWVQDNDYLYFGAGTDVSMSWDGTNLNIMPVTDDGGAINIGDGTTNMDVKVFGDATNSYLHWDQSSNTLYINTTTIKLYNGTLQLGPGQTNVALEFYDSNNFIKAVGPGQLQIGGSSTINMKSPVQLDDPLRLNVTAVDSTGQGYLYMSTGSELRWGHGAITFQALHINAAGTGNCSVPGGMILTGKLKLGTSNSQSTAQGEMYVRTSDSTLRWGHGAIEFRALHASGSGLVCTFPGHVKLDVDDDSSTTTAGEMWLQSTNSKLRWGHGAIVMEAVAVNAASPKIACEAPIVLFMASGIGSLVSKGQLMYNTANNKLYFYDGSTNHQITSA